MQTVKNITDIRYFLDKFETIDQGYNYQVDYCEQAESHFSSLPTFVAEFDNCLVNSCPILLTEDRHLITNHVWGLVHKSRHQPHKSHKLWTKWGDSVDLRLPPITKQFEERNKFVWLPIDEGSAENPWHVWIDMISKFRLLEKRWSTNFTKYIFILPNASSYFDKVAKELFPELRYFIIPKGETWRFKHLIVPSLSNHNDGVLTPPLAPWLRHFKGKYGIDESKIPTRKIYISRQGSLTRRVLNHDQLLLALKGWETVSLEKISIAEQIKIFSQASHILAPHGAGLVNLIWCKTGTKVTELQAVWAWSKKKANRETILKKVYPILSHTLKLKHKVIIAAAHHNFKIHGEGSWSGKKPAGVKRKNDMFSFKVDISDLIKYLD